MTSPTGKVLMEKSPGLSATFARDGKSVFFTGKFEGHVGA
jgi:hypothetical protein